MSTCVLCRRLQPPKRKQNGGSVIPTRRLLYEHYVVLFHLGQGFVALVAPLGVLLGGDEEFFGLGGEGLHQGVVADLAHNEVAELAPVGLLRVEVEAILSFIFLSGIEVPQVPVAALDGLLLLVLRATHTDLDTVVDAGCVADDERRSVVGLGLLDDVEVLSLAGAHSHLCHIDVAVALGNHTEVFLADLLTRGGEFGDSAGRGGLRALSAGVGVHLGVDDDDVDILAAGQDVVQTAESDIIAPAVAAEDPLALLDEAVAEFEELLADVAAALLQQSHWRPSFIMRSTRSRIWRVAVAIPRPNSALSSNSELAQAGPKPLR